MFLKARHVMTTDNLVTAGTKTRLEELERILVENRVSGVPIVDEKGAVVGVVSQSDIVRSLHADLDTNLDFFNHLGDDPWALRRRHLLKLQAKEAWEVMHSGLHTVTPETPIAEIAGMMRERRIHRVLVVEDRRLVGIVSSFDLLRPLETPEIFTESEKLPT